MVKFLRLALALGIMTLLVVTGLILKTVLAQGDPPSLPPDHPYAAFIDSHNAAIRAGATAEWRKLEGVAVDTVHHRVYFAASYVDSGMADGQGDIQLVANSCGIVYAGDLNADYDIAAVYPYVVGSLDGMCNPDNLFVDSQGNLWIGEDSGVHANNFLWMWDGTELKRFASMPAAAEVTGLRIQPDGTLFLNFQHPDAGSIAPYNQPLIGVVTGFKAGDAFESLPLPSGDDTRRLVLAAGEYTILGYVGNPISATSTELLGSITNPNGESILACPAPDGNMFLPITANEGDLYTNFECRPGTVSKMHLQRDDAGNWSVTEGEMVNFVEIGGTWNNCNASVTPWNTGLTSEESPPDTAAIWGVWQAGAPLLDSYLGVKSNPFNVGYAVELIPQPSGTQVVKHYAMGRFSQEIALVMPDSKTVYYGDDGDNRVMYKFVADNPGDLSAGTLYAAKISQDGETLNIEWIALGSGNDAAIGAAIAELQPE
ncbi:MAG: DUF839 domain-containing protein [Chloroflexi bacterium]|nr:DUF839 domain-containing protein [Chloroflexota bacterium]